MKATAYRKRPVVIDAVGPVTHENMHDVARWCGGRVTATGDLVIPTLEGDMLALPFSYVIRGVQGEFYPCKPDIFAATYEEAT